MNIPYPLLFQITCLKILASRQINLRFFICYQLYRTFKFMVKSSFTNFFIRFCDVSEVLQGPFIKTNVTNLSFYLVTHDNWIKKDDILSRYTSVATNLTKNVVFEVGLSDIL